MMPYASIHHFGSFSFKGSGASEVSQNSVLLLIQSFDTAAIQAWASKSKLQVYAFPAGGKWTALALKNGLYSSPKRAQSLSLALNAVVIDFKFFADYYMELSVFDHGEQIAYDHREMGEAEGNKTKISSYERLKPYAENPGEIDLIQAETEHYEVLAILKRAFAWRDIEQFEYDFFAQSDPETLERYEAQQLSGKKPISVSKIIVDVCGEELRIQGYVEDPEKSERHGKYHNLYFKKMIGEFMYYVSFHFGEGELKVGYHYPSDLPPEEYFKQEAAGLKETYVYKSEKALKQQLKLALEKILAIGIPYLEAQIHESFDLNEALEQSADPYYESIGFSVRRETLAQWMSQGAEFGYENNKFRIIYKMESNRTCLNIYLTHQEERSYLISVLSEMMENGLLPFKFKNYRALEVEAYFLAFRNKAEFISRLEGTYPYIELALNYLQKNPAKA